MSYGCTDGDACTGCFYPGCPRYGPARAIIAKLRLEYPKAAKVSLTNKQRKLIMYALELYGVHDVEDLK